MGLATLPTMVQEDFRRSSTNMSTLPSLPSFPTITMDPPPTSLEGVMADSCEDTNSNTRRLSITSLGSLQDGGSRPVLLRSMGSQDSLNSHVSKAHSRCRSIS